MNNEKKTPIGEAIIQNNPTGYGLFAGIGDNFNSMGQVICELAARESKSVTVFFE